jgi:hypothetical protein
MNNKPNIPQEVMPGKNYSFLVEMNINGWIFASWLANFVGDLWLYNHQECPFLFRVIIALVPLSMCLLWMRNVTRWIRGMDELHRRITLEACLFATTWTLFVIAAWQRFKHAGILEAIFRSSNSFPAHLALGFEAGPLTEYHFLYFFAIMLLFSFYSLGHFIFIRRYK